MVWSSMLTLLRIEMANAPNAKALETGRHSTRLSHGV